MNRIATLPQLDRGPPAPNVDPLSRAERAEIQRQGAKAAARGEPADTNPLGRPSNGPAATGESSDRWLQRSVAWEQGHEAQTASRRSVRLTTSLGHACEQE